MGARRVDYDRVAPTYDQRYEGRSQGARQGIIAWLTDLVRAVRPERILEVGCGTGHWLAELRPSMPGACGVDLSLGMLRRARESVGELPLVRATASALPFRSRAFDLLYCVNALHHFDDPELFVREARQCLRREGALAVIGMNPHSGNDRWYIYDYFPGTYETDLERYPSPETISAWMRSAGFGSAESGVAHRIRHEYTGREVLADPILQKNGTSQLALLSDEAYAAGRRRIDAALADAERCGERLSFPVDVALAGVTARLRGSVP